MDTTKARTRARYFAAPTTRADAGNLFNVFKYEGAREVECDMTPTHSRALAEDEARRLERRVAAP